ncbi:6-phosphogluconolactonase [Ferrimonas senticii]|uniref:6-phosphogluconolactonase n=1 Tax=Ferrimonas senticii TaxID=394566 RepID=UPI000403B261|nr:6-phosphogluconolactonase [Ferrimonas senticii]
MTTIAMPVFKSFTGAQALVDTLAQKIAAQLQDAIDARGRASLVVSGGSTPLPLFRKLSEIGIEWAEVTVTLADDRWLPADDPESNERLVRQHLLTNKAASAHFAGLVTMHATPEQGLGMALEKISHMAKPFDVVILGMGNDGHTASLFPCSEQLADGLSTDELLLAAHPTTAPHQRISFSLKALLNARQIYLHISGAEKKAVLEQALTSRDVMQMPIRAFLDQHRTPVDVYWSEQ